MRIAMLAPIARRIAPETHASTELYISALTEGLVGKGVDVTLFAARDSETNAKLAAVYPPECGQDPKAPLDGWESLHIFEAFARGEEFDLIHNHCDYRALPLVLGTTTPVLTTLHETPSAQSLPICQRVADRAFYVAASTGVGCSELKLLRTIPWGGDAGGIDGLVAGYLEVYEKILELRRREDHRPWGYYQVLLDEPTQKVKKIVVYPGQRLSRQRHQRRSEHWFAVQGQAVVTRNDEQIALTAGQAVDIPRGAWHRIHNPGMDNMAFIEVQTGDYFGEDDIERSEDDYGRSG